MLIVENNGPEIIETNYFKTEHAARGFFYMTINAGAFRLLVPDVQLYSTTDMQAATEVIISRGPWPDKGKADALELLFEDNTDDPFSIHLPMEQYDRMPGNKDANKPFIFSAWSSGGKLFEKPCFFRMVKKLPWLKPYKKG